MDQNIETLIRLKWYEIKRDYLKNLSLDDFRNCLQTVKWSISTPIHLAVAAKDIQDLTINEISNYLSARGMGVSFDLDEVEDEGTR